MRIEYTATFSKQFLRLAPPLQERFRERLEWFRTDAEDPRLRTHPLKGNLKGYWAFSGTQSIRTMFTFESKEAVRFHRIGTHDVSYR